MRFLFLSIVTVASICADILPYDIRPTPNFSQTGSIKILDQKAIDINTINGVKFKEISDLAYDTKTKRLFMLSDKGRLFGFHAKFDDNSMTLTPVSGHYLHTKRSKRLKHRDRDSEGLTMDKNHHLWVSFEGNTRIERALKNGTLTKPLKLPEPLRHPKSFRGANKGLESLTWHPRFGLITAIEYPPKGIPLDRQTLYGLSGRIWDFAMPKLHKEAVTAIETMDDGNIMVLVRSFNKKKFRVIIALLKVYINEAKKDGNCRTEVLAKMSTDDGWGVDNFEGLTRVAPHRYLMVTDNGSFIPRKTLLVYFEVKTQSNK